MNIPSPLKTEPIGNTGNIRITRNFNVILNNGKSITVPHNYIIKFSSMPQWIWEFLSGGGKYLRIAAVHGYLYKMRIFTRKESDQVLVDMMVYLDVVWWKRRMVHSVVRLLGKKAWDNNG
jgi:hypothetical protein